MTDKTKFRYLLSSLLDLTTRGLIDIHRVASRSAQVGLMNPTKVVALDSVTSSTASVVDGFSQNSKIPLMSAFRVRVCALNIAINHSLTAVIVHR